MALDDIIPLSLERAGLNDSITAAFTVLVSKLDPAFSYHLGRIVKQDRSLPLTLSNTFGLRRVEPSTELKKRAKRDPLARPAVGDWVVIALPPEHDIPLLIAILPRHGAFVRKSAIANGDHQVVAAGIDQVLLVHPLTDAHLNVGLLERQLVMAYESGAKPQIVFTKADESQTSHTEESVRIATALAEGVSPLVVSACTGEGVEKVASLLASGTTTVLIGVSGAGKSTLVNALVGHKVAETGIVRERDMKGRHTTVARTLIALPGGGVIIDTPGMRSLGLWHAETGLAAAFPEIAEAASCCRFSDCTHTHEPGCGVLAAVAQGDVAPERLERYRLLVEELRSLKESQRGRRRG